eukprot:TRINITY_DN2726_c0_g1_i2.p1 TRINITY_DN2726_c0_g1~~TRINITY_DN2726_c0_g1_i2.p1  ORF type:complete len:259 (-),score=61.67 TRINITY_DN2726_c0_g1_i2:317-1093(-)
MRSMVANAAFTLQLEVLSCFDLPLSIRAGSVALYLREPAIATTPPTYTFCSNFMSSGVALKALPEPADHAPLADTQGVTVSLEQRRRGREGVGYCLVGLPKTAFASVFAAIRGISASALAHVSDDPCERFYWVTAAWGTRAVAALFASEDGRSLNNQEFVRLMLLERLARGTAVFTMSLAAETADDVDCAQNSHDSSAQMQLVINLHYFDCSDTVSVADVSALSALGTAQQKSGKSESELDGEEDTQPLTPASSQEAE